MRFVIVTGMSGAGKSTALKMLEDMGYFCADNLPMALLDKFAELASSQEQEYNKVALGVDVRSGIGLSTLARELDRLSERKLEYEILFLDARDSVLVKRYKETRRSHPLAKDGRVDEGIAKERVRLDFLRKRADYILDTSGLLTRELNQELEKIFVSNQEFRNIFITVLSFGYKFGIPADTDLAFDVRFLPNPYYVDGLKQKTGNDPEVRDYVMGFPLAHEFLEKLEEMVDFLIPHFVIEGKNQLVISIGCTGGKHRSVTLANELYQHLKKKGEYGIKIEHRDINR